MKSHCRLGLLIAYMSTSACSSEATADPIALSDDPGGSGGITASAGAGGSVTAGAGGTLPATGGSPEAGRGGAEAGSAGVANGGTGGDGADSPLPPVTDYSEPGPFTTMAQQNVGPGEDYTVFRPETLGEDGFLHAPIIFGPGIGMQATALSDLLSSFASHGFVVVSVNVLNGGPNDPNNSSAMTIGLDWILEQNSQPGAYEGKLDMEHAVSMGYSVGGTAAVEIGGHEAVATTVSIHGHIASAALHGPMLQTSGTDDTIGRPMQQQTFDMSNVQTFFGTVMNADHGYIQRDAGGVERPAIVAWLRYWIYNDSGAKDHFFGDDCVLCTAPWVDPQRKNWE